MKKIVLAVVILGSSIIAFSHEFWLQPAKFMLKVNEPARVNIMVGENYKGERSDGRRYQVLQFKHFAAGKEEVVQQPLTGKKKSSLTMAFSTAGNHMLAFSNTGKYIGLDAKKFNEYLVEEGLNNVKEWREQHELTEKPGREFFQRCAKTLFQVGEGQDDTYARNTGMRIELIPAVNPYAIRNGDAVTFKVLFDNQPVKNALVLAWQVKNGKTTVSKIRSNEAGEVSFPLERAGRWMISSVHMVADPTGEKADWQSFWGSYTFGY
ncbi:DUF4198 domain-containing protein [Chitinophaga flava]|uniref:DUF4198 domain-containing protein n=1 Tax=Chitinophaga flava TaxID=2259036 RepID=A0A365XRB3_9BACT|nr:DUF4198 domain-containing protein [Chitinophaga flava]RBL88896.1 DUF4198 domain-containing protein [Chitinophaga flava]